MPRACRGEKVPEVSLREFLHTLTLLGPLHTSLPVLILECVCGESNPKEADEAVDITRTWTCDCELIRTGDQNGHCNQFCGISPCILKSRLEMNSVHCARGKLKPLGKHSMEARHRGPGFWTVDISSCLP